jgi:hypothetical protein
LDANEHGQRLSEEAEGIRAAQIIGKSFHLNALFDYLLERSIAGSQPKEHEIALNVFGRSSDNDLGQDSIVRVSIHRLRRKLQSYYQQGGRDRPWQLTIPTGEYRLDILAREPSVAHDEAPVMPAAAPARVKRTLLWLVGGFAVLGLIGLAVLQFMPRRDGPGTAALAPWSDVGQRSSRVIVVVSDFPLPQANGAVEDLPADSVARREASASASTRYLPIGTAMSLRAVLPLVAPLVEAPKTLNVVPISQLTPGMIANSDIIFVGYIGGLDILRDIVFAQSRFKQGDNDETLVDQKSGQTYRADPLTSEDGKKRTTRRDYSLVMSFPGPTGGRFVILAGTSDTGMIQASETATDPAALAELHAKAGSPDRFEALYEVETIGNRNLHARLVTASALSTFSWDIDSHVSEPPAE